MWRWTTPIKIILRQIEKRCVSTRSYILSAMVVINLVFAAGPKRQIISWPSHDWLNVPWIASLSTAPSRRESQGTVGRTRRTFASCHRQSRGQNPEGLEQAHVPNMSCIFKNYNHYVNIHHNLFFKYFSREKEGAQSNITINTTEIQWVKHTWTEPLEDFTVINFAFEIVKPRRRTKATSMAEFQMNETRKKGNKRANQSSDNHSVFLNVSHRFKSENKMGNWETHSWLAQLF